MIHTLEISYEISLPDAITCVHRLNERTHEVTKGLSPHQLSGVLLREAILLVFVVPELSGIN